MNKAFQIETLDHIALRSKNPEATSKWYQEVLGLKEYKPKEWGNYPIFLLAGTTGLAIFPMRDNQNLSSNYTYDHFAFRVDSENFKLARNFLASENISYQFQDHHFFHSIYFKDPDLNTVELTTIVVDPKEFY